METEPRNARTNGAWRRRLRRSPRTVLKVCGADIELGNFIQGAPERVCHGTGAGAGTAHEAARALLREIPGIDSGRRRSVGQAGSAGERSPGGGFGWPRAPQPASWEYDPQDHGRKFLPQNGGSVYIDLSHLELCLPECRDAFEHAAAWHAMLRLARAAREAANLDLPPGQTIQLLANNSDGRSSSYGCHLNLLLTREAFDNIFRRRLHYLLHFGSYLAASVVFAGSGKVGSEAAALEARYQLSQRADFFTSLVGEQTTHDRPLVNCRDESHAERGLLARLHVIFFDTTLAHAACVLKAGVTQIVLAMIEAECADPALMFEDPVDAAGRFSRDPDLQAAAPLVSGEEYRAVDFLWALFERAACFVATGRAEGVVPRAQEVMALWEDTLERMEGDRASLAARLDWALKLSILERAVEERGLSWDSPEIRYLDQVYHSLDPEEGLYWVFERLGAAERLVGEEEIEKLASEPPEGTRAFARAHLLRRAPAAEVDWVDWDSLGFRSAGFGLWSERRSFSMPDPRALGRSEVEPVLERAESVGEILDALEARAGRERGAQTNEEPRGASGERPQGDEHGPAD